MKRISITVIVLLFITFTMCLLPLLPVKAQNNEYTNLNDNVLISGGFNFVIYPYTNPIRPGIEMAQIQGYHQFIGSEFIRMLNNINFWQYTTIEVKQKPDWASIIIPENAFLSPPDGSINNFTIYACVNEDAPAYEYGEIKFEVKTGLFLRTQLGFIDEYSLDTSINIRADYLPLLSVTKPKLVEIPPDSAGNVKINMTNLANARSIIQFDVDEDEIPADWSIQLPSSVYLNRNENISLPVTVSTPRRYEYIDEWAHIPIKINQRSVVDPESYDQNYSIFLTVHCVGQGYYGEPQEVTIQGYVLDNETGSSLSNASIFFLVPNINSYIPTEKIKTNQQGYYSYPFSINNKSIMICRMQGYYSTYREILIEDDSLIWMNFSLLFGQMPETSRITGYIKSNMTGLPIENASIIFFQPINQIGNQSITYDINVTRTDQNGLFICDVKMGNVFVFGIHCDGFIPLTFHTIPDEQQLLWLDWNEQVWYNMTLQVLPSKITLVGYITDNISDNPVINATVRVESDINNGYDLYQLVKTDENGFFSIDVYPGDNVISIVHQDYFPVEIDMFIDQQEQSLNISLEPIKPYEKIYEYSWVEYSSSQYSSIHNFVGREYPYRREFIVWVPIDSVLNSIEFTLGWKDDFTHGIFGLKGRDVLTAEFNYLGVMKSESLKGAGNISVSFPIHQKPSDGSINAITQSEAEAYVLNQIHGKNMASIQVMVSLETGEKRLNMLRYLKDFGNDFRLDVRYTCYSFDLIEKN